MADQSTPRVPLEELLERAGNGDRTAFAEVYDATASHAYGIALSVTRNQAQAEDVVQEAYRDIWRESASFDATRGSGSGWVSVKVHEVAVNSVRSKQSHSNGDAKAALARVAEPARATPGSHRVQSPLSQVSAPQRTAVELAYYGGYTHAQIATMTGMPADSAKSRIREGLLELRDVMRGHGNGAPSITTS